MRGGAWKQWESYASDAAGVSADALYGSLGSLWDKLTSEDGQQTAGIATLTTTLQDKVEKGSTCVYVFV